MTETQTTLWASIRKALVVTKTELRCDAFLTVSPRVYLIEQKKSSRGLRAHAKVNFDKNTIEQVVIFEYPGSIRCNTLCCSGHGDYLCSILTQRPSSLFGADWRVCGVQSKIKWIFHNVAPGSIILNDMAVWFGLFTMQSKSTFPNMVKSSMKVYEGAVIKQAQKILQDPPHVL